jgi:hypothetical protein
MPTQTKKPKADQLYVCIESFAGHEHSVARGARFRGTHELVRKYPHFFCPADLADDEIRELREALNAPPPEREPIGRVRLRVLPGQGGGSLISGGTSQQVWANGRTYYSGEELEAEGEAARHLLDSGTCEVVKKLGRPRNQKQTGVTTGRSEDDQ